jgi:hypothetical protein
MPKNVPEFRASLRHDALFELLSRARAHPINRTSIFRGLDSKDADTFRVAACLENDETGDYYATFKHHLAFVLRTGELKEGIRQRAAAADLWEKGVLLFIFSAPRSYGGKWRITLATPSPITGDCVLGVLGWAGNNFFGDEALRRGTLNTVVAPPTEGNVLRGIITDETIGPTLQQRPCRWTRSNWGCWQDSTPPPPLCSVLYHGSGRGGQDRACPLCHQGVRGRVWNGISQAPCDLQGANPGLARGSCVGPPQVQGMVCFLLSSQ